MTRFSELNAMKQEQRNKKAEQLRLAAQIIETGCGNCNPHDVLTYEEDTGIFRWKKTMKTGKIPLGSVAGGIDDHGYVRIKFYGKQVRAHRLAWFMFYGVWPSMIDHKNGVKTDNRISNLRDVTNSQNQLNRHRARLDSIHTGVIGITLTKKRFRPHVQINGRRKFLAGCKTLEEAVALRNLYLSECGIKRPTDTEFQPCSKEAP